MRTRALALLVVCAVAWIVARRAANAREPARPLDCDLVLTIVEAHGERLACPSDPAISGCRDVKPGLRYRGCEALGPVRGPLLRLHDQPIDVNRASADDLRALPGVGAKTAIALVDGRQDAPYCSAADLEKAPRIGPKKAEAIAAAIAFDPSLCGDRRGE